MYGRILHLFQDRFGVEPTDVVSVDADGSTRSYHRLVTPGGETVIGAIGPESEENRAFLSFSRAFRSIGLPVPEIYASDEEAGVWLMEDLGDTTLFSELDEARRSGESPFPEPIREAYHRVIETLPRFQIDGHEVVDYGVAYPRGSFDQQSILWDLNYFKYHFLKLAHIPFREAPLERDFEALVTFLLGADTDHFLYRDFQSRNVMLREGQPWFIDYQGGRRGALQYDVASLLYDAKADLPDGFREELLDHYLETLRGYTSMDRETFLIHYSGYVVVRILQAMGAYGYRGFFEQKPRFLQSVPYAARNIETILSGGLPLGLPEMESVFRRIVDRWSGEAHEPDRAPGLAIHIHSFSYQRGYPEDDHGHGGGFVFDCRALPNPGKRTEFQHQTGLDPEVASYIEKRAETEAFWSHVHSLVDNQVEKYLSRGFWSLTIAFGCTGGQHRSVYFADRIARHLGHAFPEIRVEVAHRERPFWTVSESAPREPTETTD